VAESAGDDWIGVPTTAGLLGLRPHTVYALIDSDELHAEVTVPTDRPKRRRTIRIRRNEVDAYLERARVKPGELRHLHPNWAWDRYSH